MKLATILLLMLGAFIAPAHALDATEARRIAKEAYIYGYPMVDHYRIQYAYFVDSSSRDYKGPWNQMIHAPGAFSPDDKSMQTPNADTPYSFVGLDLRAEPMVLTVPPVTGGRYYSVQLIDGYTHNFAYIGTRATGSAGGRFLVAGPNWRGDVPKGIDAVFRSETELAFAFYRTQLFSPDDLPSVRQVQAGYQAQPLYRFLGRADAPAAPDIAFVAPLTVSEQRNDLRFFEVLNFVLDFAPTHPSERELMARFAPLGIGPGRRFDAQALSPELREAIAAGIADAWAAFAEFKASQLATGKLGSGNLFGNREFLNNNYLNRMAGAVLGIYGNSREEALYPSYLTDTGGQPLNGAAARYTLRFGPNELPPVAAFWSLTLYELPASLLMRNPLNRYLINSASIPSLQRDPDGGITLYIQHESPGTARETNWLPAPNGPFWVAMRLYLPRPEALNGSWKLPPLQTVP
jgi:hypothetical protein